MPSSNASGWQIAPDGRADNFGLASQPAGISGKANQGLISAKVQRAYLEG